MEPDSSQRGTVKGRNTTVTRCIRETPS